MASTGTVLLLLAIGGTLLALGALGAESFLDLATKGTQALHNGVQVFLNALGTGPHLWATLGAAFIIAAAVLFITGFGRGKPKKN
ncbi:MAG TPA: hypothetical protein VNZ52_13760 [Candidatus Thermoplasmatota archaeon]|nr:hypothetical protein [Candidatus Thermoplasmatota archaeon]